MRMALRAAHFQLQCLYGFFRLKAGRENVFRGRGRGGGEYTVLEVKGYPGDVVQYIGDVPPGLNRKCLKKTYFPVGLSRINYFFRDVYHHYISGYCLSKCSHFHW